MSFGRAAVMAAFAFFAGICMSLMLVLAASNPSVIKADQAQRKTWTSFSLKQAKPARSKLMTSDTVGSALIATSLVLALVCCYEAQKISPSQIEEVHSNGFEARVSVGRYEELAFALKRLFWLVMVFYITNTISILLLTAFVLGKLEPFQQWFATNIL
eukprot:EG_transcript_39881